MQAVGLRDPVSSSAAAVIRRHVKMHPVHCNLQKSYPTINLFVITSIVTNKTHFTQANLISIRAALTLLPQSTKFKDKPNISVYCHRLSWRDFYFEAKISTSCICILPCFHSTIKISTSKLGWFSFIHFHHFFSKQRSDKSARMSFFLENANIGQAKIITSASLAAKTSLTKSVGAVNQQPHTRKVR